MGVLNRRRKHDVDKERAFSPAYSYFKRWRRGTSIQPPSVHDLEAAAHFKARCEQRTVKECFRALADDLCKTHPEISTDPGIFGGMPHIRNVRLSVGDILSKVYVYGSTSRIVDIYAPHVSEEQVKAAIAYAQDFLETACDPNEPSEGDD